MFWQSGMTMFMYHALSPWLGLVDPARFAAECERSRALGMTTIASAHSPLITTESIDAAYEIARTLPTVTPPDVPGQDVLDEVIAATAA